MKLPLYTSKIKAGFPSPADDYITNNLDINQYLVENENSTFLVRVAGESMTGDGILPNDILIVDKSINYYENKIVVAHLNNEFCVKRYQNKKLISSNKDYPIIQIKDSDEFIVWGVVIGSFRKFH